MYYIILNAPLIPTYFYSIFPKLKIFFPTKNHVSPQVYFASPKPCETYVTIVLSSLIYVYIFFETVQNIELQCARIKN